MKTIIDYKYILEYIKNIKNNRELSYSDPQMEENEEQRKQYETIKKNGQAIVCEMEKISLLITSLFPLNECNEIKWMDGSCTRTRSNLCIQLKSDKYSESLISISLYVECSEASDAMFRVSLDIQNDSANSQTLSQYHSHLDIPNNGLTYVSGDNQWGAPEILNETQDIIKQRVACHEYNKVQICSVINENSQYSNDDYEQAILTAVEKLMPYYEYVLSDANNDTDISVRKENNMNTYSKNMILYGPPGTGKTFNTVIYAVAICEGKTINEVSDEAKADYASVKSRYDQLMKEERIAFTTFHQSYGYEEFIEGIKPDAENGNISYNKEDGIFKAFCKKAGSKTIKRFPYDKSDATIKSSLDRQSAETIENNNCVFIIDEINRGNISKIFGELITLIEDTKREGNPEAASAILPYTGEEFSVPDNVYILGTMNTADRSIALMDTALRRRFRFIELMPDSSVLIDNCAATLTIDEHILDIARMLDIINERISFLYDREHTIGHAFFMKLKDNPTIETLAEIFEKSVIPLLQEYFYEDYRKIQLVLGDNAKTDDDLKFIKDMPVKAREVFKGIIDDIVDLPERKYEINKNALKKIESYIQIM